MSQPPPGYDQAKAETAGDKRNQKLRWHHFGALEKRTRNWCTFLILPELVSWKFCGKNLKFPVEIFPALEQIHWQFFLSADVLPMKNQHPWWTYCRTSTLDERYLTAPWMWKGHDSPFTGDSLATTITPMTQMSGPGRIRITHRATGPLPHTYWFGEEERLSIWVYSLNMSKL